MELAVCSLTGDEICRVTSQLERVSDLKEEIYRVAQISPKLQKLLLGDQILKNGDPLAELLPNSQAVIQLIRTDKWSEEVQRDWKRLRKASEAVRNDKELVMACMDASGGEAIKYAGEDVRADREIMLAAMNFDKALCRYARGSLHTDREFLLAALDYKGPLRPNWLRWQSSPALCADYDFLLQMLAEDGASFRLIREDMRSDPRLARVAIQNYPFAFRFALNGLRKDRQLATVAVNLDPTNLEFVDENLKADRAFVLQALETVRLDGGPLCHSILKHLPNALRSDVEVVSKAVRRIYPHMVPKELEYVNDLKHHPEIRALNPYAVAAAPVRSRPSTKKTKVEEEEMDTRLSQEARNLLMHADDARLQQPSFWLELVKMDPFALSLIEDRQQDKQLVMTAVKKCGSALQHASEFFKQDHEVVKMALKESQWAYDYIPEAMRLDREIAVLAFRLHRTKLPKQLLNDKEAVVAAAEIVARRGECGELSRKKLNRMSIANLIAEFELA